MFKYLKVGAVMEKLGKALVLDGKFSKRSYVLALQTKIYKEN